MNEVFIPEYWLTGLGSWAVSYLLHSSVILGGILLITHLVGFFNESHKDVLLKIGLIAGIFTASLQFVQSSNGLSLSTIVLPVQGEKNFEEDEFGQNGRILSSDGLHLLVPQPSMPSNLGGETSPPVDWLKVILLCWLIGALLFGMRFAWLWRNFNRLTGQRFELNHRPTIELCEKLRRQMAINRPIQLTCSGQINSPMAIGLSQICIPDGLWEQVDQEQLTAIIAHELAHLARTDPLWLFFWHFMGVIFFFQPLNKLAQLSFQSRAEFLADATAVRQTKDPVAMVNSLMSAAKLVNGSMRSNMASALLGSHANIVARSQMLLAENPQKIKTPLPLIAFAALLIVAASTYWLPNVSLSRSHGNAIVDMPKYGELNSENAKPWTLFSSTRLNYRSNIEFNQSLAGVRKVMRTRLVTFDYDLDGIADITPFGQLRFASHSIYSQKSLVIEADYQGKVWYQFRVDGELIDDQLQALAFIRQMLDDNLAASDEFKRNMMRLYSVQGFSTSEAQLRFRFQSIYDAAPSHLDSQALEIVKLFAQQADLFTVGQNHDPGGGLQFFNAMAHSGDNMASFNDFGYLAISSKSKKPGSVSVQYNLNNRALLEAFAKASGKRYQSGETERELVHFLVMLHFNVPHSSIRWLNE